MKYAQFNKDTCQMVGFPKDLPSRWTTAEGVTLNNFNLLPADVLYSLGWVPVVYAKLLNAEAYYYSSFATWDSEKKRFVYDALPMDLEALCNSCLDRIDQAASDACARHCSTGVGQESRYAAKYADAMAYLGSVEYGGDISSVAGFVALEAAACGVSEIEKAQEIVAAHDSWLDISAKIEAARIGGKTKCRACTTHSAMLVQRDEAIATLEEL